MSVMQIWRIWLNTSKEFTKNWTSQMQVQQNIFYGTYFIQCKEWHFALVKPCVFRTKLKGPHTMAGFFIMGQSAIDAHVFIFKFELEHDPLKLMLSFCRNICHWLRSADSDENFVEMTTFPFWCTLTHCGLVTPYGDMELGQHWLR